MRPAARRPLRIAALLSMALLLAACASAPPIDAGGADRTLAPREAATTATDVVGSRVVWGGTIVTSNNLADATRIEVLAYPLNDSLRPRTDQSPAGRFLVQAPGYLETQDYAPGRLLTVTGNIARLADGRIGDAPYRFPILAPDQMHLWPRNGGGGPSGPQFHIGVGVLFGG